MASLHFVIGGARSGKSAFAEQLALTRAGTGMATYIATAEIFDDDMAGRVALHQERRGAQWQLVESPVNLAAAIETADAPNAVLLIDFDQFIDRSGTVPFLLRSLDVDIVVVLFKPRSTGALFFTHTPPILFYIFPFPGSSTSHP